MIRNSAGNGRRKFGSFANLLGELACCLFVAAAAVPASEPSPRKEAIAVNVEIVAHRGASFDAPENTLVALRTAWDQQADAVEFDVRLTADGQIVLLHDADTRRTAGVDRRVDSQTLEELQQLDVGSWKDRKFAGEKLPTLAQALEIVPAGKRALIEIKSGPQIVPELERVLDSAALPLERTAIICFSADVCQACKAAMPELKVYWLVGLERDAETGLWNHTAEELIATAVRLELDGLDLQACDLIDAGFVRKIRAANLELHVWTVNDPELARRLATAGVQGITTDRPAWLREQLASP